MTTYLVRFATSSLVVTKNESAIIPEIHTGMVIPMVETLTEIMAGILLGIMAGILLEIMAGTLTETMAGTLTETLLGIMAGTLTEIMAGILLGTMAGTLTEIMAGTLLGIMAGTLTETMAEIIVPLPLTIGLLANLLVQAIRITGMTMMTIGCSIPELAQGFSSPEKQVKLNQNSDLVIGNW